MASSRADSQQGIVYFFGHRDLWKPLASKLLPSLMLGITTLASVFIFGYLPQAAVLAVFNGPLAAVNAALLCLSESSTIFNTLAKSFLVEDSLVDTFDGTLVAKGQAALVSKERKVGRAGDAIGRLGKLVTKPSCWAVCVEKVRTRLKAVAPHLVSVVPQKRRAWGHEHVGLEMRPSA